MPTVIMIAGNRTILGTNDVVRGRGEGIPVAGTGAAEGCAFDLIGGSCRAEEKTFGETCSGNFHCASRGAGPVDWPTINSASSNSWINGPFGLLMRSIRISASRRPASRTDERVAV